MHTVYVVKRLFLLIPSWWCGRFRLSESWIQKCPQAKKWSFMTRTVNLLFVDPCIIVYIIYIENPTRCNNVSKFYFVFVWSSTCFGRHTAHHQELKIALAASGFAHVEGCWTCKCWTLSASTRSTTFHVCKTKGCQCSFRFLMMGGVSPETCWASYKYEIKFWYTVASYWIFYVNWTRTVFVWGL
jgi:hypothetical protein